MVRFAGHVRGGSIMKDVAIIRVAAVAAIGIAAVAGVYAATRGGATDTVVTRAQAEVVLASLYDARDDADALCALATSNGNCRSLLDGAGDAPAQPPTIVCSAWYAGDTTQAAGPVVRIRNEGVPDDTESLVLDVDGKARFMNPVYWNGARVTSEPTAQPDTGYHCT
jgi:hypothetical protein